MVKLSTSLKEVRVRCMFTVFSCDGIVHLAELYLGFTRIFDGMDKRNHEWYALNELCRLYFHLQGNNGGGDRKTTLTFASPNTDQFEGTYTCTFLYTDASLEDYEGTIDFKTRCKFPMNFIFDWRIAKSLVSFMGDNLIELVELELLHLLRTQKMEKKRN